MLGSKDLQTIASTYLYLSAQYTSILMTMDERELNKVPYTGSWTAAQVIQHIGKANHSGFLSAPGQKAHRDIGEQIPMLEREFLNFDIKMYSPDFLIPANRTYTKQETLEIIQIGVQSLAENLPKGDLTLILETPLGIVTKLELVNFIVFHSKRHLHQLDKIQIALRPNETPRLIDLKNVF